jgi:hypothetical protein
LWYKYYYFIIIEGIDIKNTIIFIIIESINIKNSIICAINNIIFIIIESINIKNSIICGINIIIFIIILLGADSWVWRHDPRLIGPASGPNSLGSLWQLGLEAGPNCSGSSSQLWAPRC